MAPLFIFNTDNDAITPIIPGKTTSNEVLQIIGGSNTDSTSITDSVGFKIGMGALGLVAVGACLFTGYKFKSTHNRNIELEMEEPRNPSPSQVSIEMKNLPGESPDEATNE